MRVGVMVGSMMGRYSKKPERSKSGDTSVAKKKLGPVKRRRKKVVKKDG